MCIFIVIYNNFIVCITSSVRSFSCIYKKIFKKYKNISFYIYCWLYNLTQKVRNLRDSNYNVNIFYLFFVVYLVLKTYFFFDKTKFDTKF